MKVSSVQTIAVLLVVLICAQEAQSWGIRTRWVRRVVDFVCKNVWKYVCTGPVGKRVCKYAKTRVCKGRKKRDLAAAERGFENNGGQVLPLSLDFNAWVASCGEQTGGPKSISYDCFRQANEAEDNQDTQDAFADADANNDGGIDLTEFRLAPFLFEGEESGAPLGLQIAAAIARNGGLPDGDEDGSGNGNGNGSGNGNGNGNENSAQGEENANGNGNENGGNNNGNGKGPSKRTMDGRLKELEELLQELQTEE